MGNCLSKKPNNLASASQPTVEDEGEKLKFQVRINKLKARGSGLDKASLVLKFGKLSFELGERICVNSELHWSSQVKFSYEVSFKGLCNQTCELYIYQKEKVRFKVSVHLIDIILGPAHQNFPLFKKNKQRGRIGFTVEMLEEKRVRINASEIKCHMEEPKKGKYLVSLKLVSDRSITSPESHVSEKLKWYFAKNQFSEENYPQLEFPGTVKTIREAAIQVLIWKQTENNKKLIGENWLSFTKLFKSNIENIYRNESSIYSASLKQSTIKKSFLEEISKKVHFKRFNEDLWYNGKKVGTVEGSLQISNLPAYQQIIAGVNTETGYQVQSSTFINGKKSNFLAKSLPNEIRKLEDLVEQLKESILKKKKNSTFSNQSRSVAGSRKALIGIIEILQKTERESMVCFIYNEEQDVVKAQNVFLDLGEHLADYSECVQYDIKPFYFKALRHLVVRGELGLGYLSLNSESTPEKFEIAKRYRLLLYSMLNVAVSRMAFKGVDEETQEFTEMVVAMAWVRVPEFRGKFVECLKKSGDTEIEEWRGEHLDSEEQAELLPVIDWPKKFYAFLESDYKATKRLNSALENRAWQVKMQKRGVAFFKFLSKWSDLIRKEFVVKSVLWPSIPDYEPLVNSFLCEVKTRQIENFPEALIQASCGILKNPRLISVLVMILFKKCNVYMQNQVCETFNIMQRWFETLFTTGHKLPSNFDNLFFENGLKVTLKSTLCLNVTKVLWFLYYEYHMIQEGVRRSLVYKFMVKKDFYSFFFHWNSDTRVMFYNFITFRVLSKKHFSFEKDSDLDRKLIKKLEKRIEEADQVETPYSGRALQEFNQVRDEYEEWLNKLPADKKGKLYGVSNEFPYPQVAINMQVGDLIEMELDEEW